jgi:hypothetical protein
LYITKIKGLCIEPNPNLRNLAKLPYHSYTLS